MNDSPIWLTTINVLGVLATVAAAWLAYLAIRQSARQGKTASEALVRERRLDFELEKLDTIDESLSRGNNVGFVVTDIQRALRLLPPLEMPRMRQWYSVEAPGGPYAGEQQRLHQEFAAKPAGGLYEQEVEPGLSLAAALRQEVHRAIRTRMDERT